MVACRYVIAILQATVETMRYLPLFKNVRQRPCLVVGGGPVAQRKIDLLLRAEADVIVVAPEATDHLRRLNNTGRLTWSKRQFKASDVDGRALVFSATGDNRVDRAVSAAAHLAGVPVNVVDTPDLSDFITPAIVDRDPIVVAVSSSGAAPVLARQIRATVEALLPASLGQLATAAHSLRKQLRDRLPDLGSRRRFWTGFFRNWRSDSLLAGKGAPSPVDATAIDRFLAEPTPAGRVSIVGAGPGDPDLLTLKALQALQDADVIIYDRLVGADVLDYARRDAEKIYVGKAPGHHTHNQDEINALLTHHAEQGQQVVRLKGGDPFIFGRGGEECAYLAERGIEVKVVPGITAAAGCAASTGIPLTHRGTARSVTYLTGTSAGDIPNHDWSALAQIGGTLVIYMGVGTAQAIADRLLENGLVRETPVAVIENGTLPTQRTVTGTLGGLGALIRGQAVHAPALLVIGEVAALADIAAPKPALVGAAS
jgi:uroporphyrin-III C-methyltransferase/precorrin-2 dehydrogenase/sirohydrochlorin ferrochelatase